MKDFDRWNKAKKKLEVRSSLLEIRDRQVWWASLGLNIGDEEDGKNEFFERPVLIVRKFNNKIAWVLPLTSKPGNKRFYYPVSFNRKKGFVILSQLRLVSIKRLLRYVGEVTIPQHASIKRKLIRLLK